MKTLLFCLMSAAALLYLLGRASRPSNRQLCVDVIVPAFNEEPIIRESLISLLRNRFVQRIICVNDGSTDRTADIVAELAPRTGNRLLLINQENGGKGSAIMNGLLHATADYVFLTDADTYVDPRGQALGYMIAELEAGADAVGGIPSSDLRAGGLLSYVRATVKLPMIIIKRTFQQILGGAPFIISGACGMFRTDVLREVGMTDRTNVEDLDLTWTLVARGYKVRQANRAIVYPQESKTLREEWRRWRRWIMGYAACMRLHRRLLLTRYGLFSILPMFATAAIGILLTGAAWGRALVNGGPLLLPMLLFPVFWLLIVLLLGAISATHHGKLRLIPMAPFAVLYVGLAYVLWVVHGLRTLLTGREYRRDKPTRYTHVVA
jgi:cellulose synthase/poly-beta-1,6-N-acetylglucosamine synthase-like glycosyltransferase